VSFVLAVVKVAKRDVTAVRSLSINREQSEHIGQWATPHHLSDVRNGAPSWIWDYLAHSDITIYV